MAKKIVDKSCQSKLTVRFWFFLSYLITTVPPAKLYINCIIGLCILESYQTPSSTLFFKRSYKILIAKCQNWTFKEIFYVKNHQIFLIFFSLKNKNLGAHFMLKLFFANFNFKTTFLLKSGLIFDKAAKLNKATWDTYILGGWC